MSNLNKTRKFYLKPWFYFLFGITFLTAAQLLPDLAKKIPGGETSGFWELAHEFLAWLIAEAQLIGLTSLGVAVLLFVSTQWILSFWEEHIQPLLEHHKSVIKKSTEEATEAISDLQRDISETVKNSNLEMAVANSDHETIKSRLGLFHEKAFGQHCNREQSLYNHLVKDISSFLDPRIPHRSNYHQEIDIQFKEGKTIWHETSSYDLHAIALDNEFKTPMDGDIEPYRFTYQSSAKYEELSELSIQIFVDDKELYDTTGKLHLISTTPLNVVSTDESIDVKVEDDHIIINIPCCIEINKAFTNIKVIERSVLQEDDLHYISKSHHPTYNYTQSFNLPDEWTFEFFYPANNDWLQHTKKDSKRFIRKTGWVTPGLLMCCRWKKNA